MKRSIYRGHLIDDSDSGKLLEKAISDQRLAREKLSPTQIEALKKQGITDWEQLYSQLKIESALDGLQQTLQLSDREDLQVWRSLCQEAIPEVQLRRLEEVGQLQWPTGARKPERVIEYAESFLTPDLLNDEHSFLSSLKANQMLANAKIQMDRLASSVNHIRQMNPIRNQHERGTCSAFAVTAANEYAFRMDTGRPVDLSEQYLFYEAKAYENDSVCGAWVESAMEMVAQVGQCRETTWSYNPSLPCVQQYGEPAGVDALAAAHRNPYIRINPNNVYALKIALANGRVIPFSIPVFDSWYESEDTRLTGRITMPNPGEEESGGHAMALVGYQDDRDHPGGGIFILRNSWGLNWGWDCPYGAGYGTIPYQYISDYIWEAFAF